eukprot:gnl/TRDRNA2_/TRDRNA2_186984_c0_seq1.p1 gnl/TRDRNA2_/TRDRNA2_186984_c0~~gnl/TRDRNA2_/TRDRNA2_186984_c0_seq1.p1  ORF type:complete len:157 (+),score=34.81 gnl/TRDRNA2_/TRDRNA2_186984_c0_seq1:61-531(+)
MSPWGNVCFLAIACFPAALSMYADNSEQCLQQAGMSAAAATEIEDKIRATPVYMYAIPNMRCTLSGQSKFRSCGIALQEDNFVPEDIASTWANFGATTDPTWKYMNCRYPVSQGGMVMHSYIFVDGQLKGDGFDVASMSCSQLRSEDAARRELFAV